MLFQSPGVTQIHTQTRSHTCALRHIVMTLMMRLMTMMVVMMMTLRLLLAERIPAKSINIFVDLGDGDNLHFHIQYFVCVLKCQ